MKLSFTILLILYLAFGLRDIDIKPTSPYAISIVIGISDRGKKAVLGDALYQLLIIHQAVREFNKSKPDIIVWLTTGKGTVTADEILKENISTKLYQFLETLPGLFFADGDYLCSETGNNVLEWKHDFAFIKLKAWKLEMYKKVVHYDLDIIPIAPSGFDRMFGVWPEQDMWERKLLDEQDLVGGVVGSPINGGLLLLKPSHTTYRTMCRILEANVGRIHESKAWGKYKNFENPFCDQDLFDNNSQSYQGAYFEGGYFKGIFWQRKDWLVRNFPINKTADRKSDWDFVAAYRDQGFIWYYWVLKESTRGKVLITSEYLGKSFIFDPNGDPKCGSYPLISIIQSNIHFMGGDKIQKMGLSGRWLDRVKKTIDAYKILQFEELTRYHDQWMKAIRDICCEPEQEGFRDYWWSPKESGCIAYFKFCSCNCH